MVHGDDFTCSGKKAELTKLAKRMAEWWEIKMRGIMGSAAGEVKQMTILGRTVRWTEDGIEYEADGKHREELIKEAGLTEDSNAVGSAAVRPKVEDEELKKMELGDEMKRKFRGLAARLNYLGQDRSDVQYATKEICRGMAKLAEEAFKSMKRLG